MQLFYITPLPETGKSNEWYTPAKYIEAARSVMGSIDLDPASCELANRTVKAARYYTKEENGLALPWYGNVWLNPPYGRTPEMRGKHQSTIEQFTTKLQKEYHANNVTQAILLATNQIEAAWFLPLWKYPICFMNHKVHFIIPFEKRDSYSHMFGTCFVYLGPHESRFIDIFSQFGTIAKRVSQPKQPSHIQSVLDLTQS